VQVLGERRELQAHGLDVINVAWGLNALECLDRDPGIQFALVDLRKQAGARPGLAFALMMHSRNRKARIALMSTHPERLEFPEAAPFGKIRLKVPSMSSMTESFQDFQEQLRFGAASQGAEGPA
jgi:hypothetical protein